MTDSGDEMQAETAPGEELVGTVVAERYRVLEQLGVGGMGTVFLAEHVHMRKRVALKVLHKQMTYVPEVVERFRREAIAAARIEHPHVAVATDFGELENGAFYLVLEYVDGRSLTKELEGGAMPPERALSIALQITEALAAAHAADIIHRDLKPDNVMLVDREGSSDFVKVLDFGIAKIAAEDSGGAKPLTQLGSVFGTPQYMAPEQAMGKPVDLRADLYAVGIILYEMLNGAPPFESEQLVAVLTKQITEPPPPLPDTVPAEARTVVDRLLAKEPAERYQTAQEVVEALLDAGGSPASSVAAAAAVAATSQREAAIAQTMLDAGDAPTSRPAGEASRRNGFVLAGVAVAVLAAGAFFLAGGDDEQKTSAAKAAASSTATGSQPTSSTATTKAPRKQAANTKTPSAPKPAPTATTTATTAATSGTETKSSSKTTVSRSGSTVTKTTTKSSSKRTYSNRTTRKKTAKQKKKRKTGPFGIYVPPPKDWLK